MAGVSFPWDKETFYQRRPVRLSSAAVSTKLGFDSENPYCEKEAKKQRNFANWEMGIMRRKFYFFVCWSYGSASSTSELSQFLSGTFLVETQ
jgi:hypothetical protein